MSKAASSPPPPEVPPALVAEWWLPFAGYLAQERRFSPYTLRNYRQAFVDFYHWLAHTGLEKPFDELDARDVRDFVIEAQRRFGRRTLHNHVSGLRAFFKYWLRLGRVKRNPFAGVPLPKGLVKDVKDLSLKTADGKAVPASFSLLNKWPDDGSVRWALLDTQLDVPAGGSVTITLRLPRPLTICSSWEATEGGNCCRTAYGTVEAKARCGSLWISCAIAWWRA